jgi:hypothetical protein
MVTEIDVLDDADHVPERPGERTRRYQEASKADATWRAYRTDFEHFVAWCAQRQLQSLPAAPSTVADYLTDLAARLKVSTIQRRASSISQAHQVAGFPSPTQTTEVRLALQGIRRTHGPQQRTRKAAPAVTAIIRKLVHGLDDSLINSQPGPGPAADRVRRRLPPL